ncbi:MAG: AsmA family protein [Calditrichaeota bacterium]|nr:AsmA family protein [Calditrichota bacterium]
MIRKIAYIAVHAAIVFLTLILIALLVLTKVFSPEKIRTLIRDNLSVATSRAVEIEAVSFNAFKGLMLSNVNIYEKSDGQNTPSDSALFFHIDKLELRYFLPALLKMELQVNKIVFDHPVFHLVQDSSGAWNFDDIFAADTTAMDTAAADTSPGQLPFTLNVKEIALKNLVVQADVAQRDSHIVLRSGGVSLTVSETFLPKFSSKKFEKKVRTKIVLQSDDQPWNIFIENKNTGSAAEYQAKLRANLSAKVHSLETFSATAAVSVTDARARFRKKTQDSFDWVNFPLPQVFSLGLNLQGNARSGDFQVQQLDFALGQETVVELTGKIRQAFKAPFFDLKVVRSDANLERLFTSFVPFLPDSLREQLEGLKFAGRLSFLGSKFRGNPTATTPDSALQFRAALNLLNFSFEQAQPLTKVENLNVEFFATGTVQAGNMQDARANLKFNAAQIFSLADTVAYSAEKITADFYGHLNANFLPDTVNGKLRIGNVFDSPLTLAIDVKASDNFNKFLATLNLKSDSLSLGKLTQEAAAGNASVALQVTASSLDSIVANLQMKTGELEVISEPENLTFSPLKADGRLLFSADTAFQLIRLNPSTLTVGDFADMFFSGELALTDSPRLKLTVDSLIVKHSRLWRALPEILTEELSGLSIRGKTRLIAHSDFDLSAEGDSAMIVVGDVFLNGGFDYPEQFISVGKINSHFSFHSNGFSSSAAGAINVDSLVLIGVQDKPVEGIQLTTKLHMPSPEQIVVDSARLEIPQWKMELTAAGALDSLSGVMKGKFRSFFAFNSEGDTTRLLNDDLALCGKLSLKNDMQIAGDELRVGGSVQTDWLDIFYADLLQIDSLAGRINFAEALDMVNGTVISAKSGTNKVNSAHKFFYDVFRPYYLTDEKNQSVLTIKSVRAMNYLIENFRSDILIKNEKIEIPNFQADIYGGNVSGQIFVNIADGTPENIQWLVKANVARLNSSRLLPAGRLEEESAELDMTLELNGKGVDPAEYLELSGFLYVTKIGVKFTDNMLQSLDPQQTDKSIQDTRRLLKWGYKPKLVSVEIKHDNLYPTIHLVKGSFFAKLIPLNLSGGKIELARIPLQIIFSSLETSSQ